MSLYSACVHATIVVRAYICMVSTLSLSLGIMAGSICNNNNVEYQMNNLME